MDDNTVKGPWGVEIIDTGKVYEGLLRKMKAYSTDGLKYTDL